MNRDVDDIQPALGLRVHARPVQVDRVTVCKLGKRPAPLHDDFRLSNREVGIGRLHREIKDRQRKGGMNVAAGPNLWVDDVEMVRRHGTRLERNGRRTESCQ